MRQFPKLEVPYTLAVCSALALGGCTDKKKPEAETTQAAPADGENGEDGTKEVAKPDEPAPAPDGRPEVLATVLPHEKGTVFGHFVIPNGAQLLTETKEQLMIPAYKGFLDEAALRSLVSLQLPEKRKPLAQNFNIAAPMGCVLVDIKAYKDAPASCTFAYKGGAKQLVTDLGDQDKQADAAGHLAKYRLEGQDVYVDELGDHVVLSGYDDVFAKTRVYIEKNLIGRAGSIRGDFEAVGFLSDAFAYYRQDIQPFLDEYEQMQQPPTDSTGHPGLDAAVKVWTDYNHKSTEQTIQSFGEMAQVSFYMGIEPVGVVTGMSIVPAPGSRFERNSKATGGARISQALSVTAPAKTLMMASFGTKPEAFDNEQAAEVRKVVAESWGALTGHPPSDAENAMTEFLNEYRDNYTGHGLMALVDAKASPLFGAMMASELKPGKSTRSSFEAFSKRFTPEAVVGKEFSQYVTWKFDMETHTVDGVPVDRFTLEPTPKAKQMLEKEMSAKDKEQVDKWFGGIRLIVDRSEVEGRVIWTMSPKGENGFAEQVIAAQKGKGNIGGEPIGRMLTHDPAASAVMGFDVKSTIAWLKDFPELDRELAEVPDTMGNDLSDVFVTTQQRTDGVFVGEFVIAQPLLDQIKDEAAKRGL
jgi:hypothetical protein